MGKQLTFRLPDGKEHLWEKAIEKFKEKKGEPKSSTEIIIELLSAYIHNPKEIISFIEEERKRRKERKKVDKEILERLEREGVGEPALTEKIRKRLENEESRGR